MATHQRAAVQMTASEILSLLREGRTAAMATVGPGGAIHLVAMWYALIDGVVHFETKVKSQKAVNLRRNPRISCLIELGDSYDELRGVAVEGTATIIDDPEVPEYWGAATNIYERYQGPYTEAARPGIEQMMRKRVVVKVNPERIRSWDHRKLKR